jgi:hypothetical protein
MSGLFGQIITVGAHAVGLATHATPAMNNHSLTEVYLTQPALMADAAYGPLQFNGMLNFEGLTLQRGELNAGVWGEGYVDRRHPHTYLHEAVITLQARALGHDFSISAGRGFAPFGTDDPMVRPFVKYPANHHLAQILERPLALAAVRRGPLIIEAGLFTGVEPLDPEDLGDVDKFGDSWSARATVLPRPWLELQGSYADVTSPENQFGDGLDHTMWHVSARVQRSLASNDVYALVETAETAEGADGVEFFHYRTLLAEAGVMRGVWQMAARFERTIRPEEERRIDRFRAVRPHTDNSILGRTRWTSGSLSLSRTFTHGRAQFRPFIEVVGTHASSLDAFPVIRPEDLYGSNNLWSFSVGIRSTLGSWHQRMGRYGAARTAVSHHH